MQPQYAAFVGTITQGDLPTEGMAALYVEVVLGNGSIPPGRSRSKRPKPGRVLRSSSANSACSRCIPNPVEVLEAGRVVLSRIGLEVQDRVKPEIVSIQVITNIDPYQAQLLNRFRRGSILVPGETLLVLERALAAYINYAFNEAEALRSSRTTSVPWDGSAACGYPARNWKSSPRKMPL